MFQEGKIRKNTRNLLLVSFRESNAKPPDQHHLINSLRCENILKLCCATRQPPVTYRHQAPEVRPMQVKNRILKFLSLIHPNLNNHEWLPATMPSSTITDLLRALGSVTHTTLRGTRTTVTELSALRSPGPHASRRAAVSTHCALRPAVCPRCQSGDKGHCSERCACPTETTQL